MQNVSDKFLWKLCNEDEVVPWWEERSKISKNVTLQADRLFYSNYRYNWCLELWTSLILRLFLFTSVYLPLFFGLFGDIVIWDCNLIFGGVSHLLHISVSLLIDFFMESYSCCSFSHFIVNYFHISSASKIFFVSNNYAYFRVNFPLEITMKYLKSDFKTLNQEEKYM